MTKIQRAEQKLHNALRAVKLHIQPGAGGKFDMKANQTTIAMVPRINRWAERLQGNGQAPIDHGQDSQVLP